MAKTPFTLRIGPEERKALENLSKVVGCPINQLLNDAIKMYLRQRGPIEASLDANLEALRAYRRRDPGYKGAIDAFVEFERSEKDPIEGEAATGHLVHGELKPVGAAHSKARELLNA